MLYRLFTEHPASVDETYAEALADFIKSVRGPKGGLPGMTSCHRVRDSSAARRILTPSSRSLRAVQTLTRGCSNWLDRDA